jgi:hypothetical protein
MLGRVSLDELPPPAERDALLDELADLVARVGPEPFVTAPIVEPTNEFFPDVWTADEAGVERLARRLFGYAGLADVEVAATTSKLDHAADEVWIQECDDRRCLVGVGLDRLSDPAGHLATVTAAAFRVARGLAPLELGAASGYRGEPHQDDDQLAREGTSAEVAALFLGFGVLAANHCFRREVVAGRFKYTVARRRRTFLAPQTLAFGLAVQAAVRGLGWWARHRLAGHLEANPAGYFDAAWEVVGNDAHVLKKRLGLHG